MTTPRAWSRWQAGLFISIAAATTLFLLGQTPLNDLVYNSLPSPTKPNRWPSTSQAQAQASTRNFISAGEALDVAILSPNGRFKFSLEQTGQLVLQDLHEGRQLFDSDTNIGWPVVWRAALTDTAELRLTWAHPTAKPYKGEPWVSSLLPNCTTAGSHGIVDSDAKPVLELLDSGKLHIRVGIETTCILHSAIEDRGRLAIVYPGFLRTFDKTCEEHMQKIVDRWPGSGADVHVLAYYEEAWLPDGAEATEESLSNRLRKCFGDHLKTIQIRHVSEIEESWHDLPASLAHVCLKDKLKRHLSQFKTTYLVGQQLRRYMMQHAVQYDYILKLRMDLTLWGDIPDLDPSFIPRDGIVAPRIALDWVFYSLVHDGSLRQGVSDIAAFGRTAAMFTYLDLYRELVWLRETEKEIAKYKAVNTHFHAKERVPDPEHCTPENILAYWLELSGVPVATDWRWQMALLRGDGSKKFTCPINQRLWNCPGFVP